MTPNVQDIARQIAALSRNDAQDLLSCIRMMLGQIDEYDCGVAVLR